MVQSFQYVRPSLQDDAKLKSKISMKLENTKIPGHVLELIYISTKTHTENESVTTKNITKKILNFHDTFLNVDIVMADSFK